MKIASKRVVLFDLDGTLIDTRDLILTSYQRASIDILGRAIPRERLLPLIGIPLITQAEILAPEHAEELVRSYHRHNMYQINLP